MRQGVLSLVHIDESYRVCVGRTMCTTMPVLVVRFAGKSTTSYRHGCKLCVLIHCCLCRIALALGLLINDRA